MRLQPLIACLVRSNYIWINLATRNLPSNSLVLFEEPPPLDGTLALLLLEVETLWVGVDWLLLVKNINELLRNITCCINSLGVLGAIGQIGVRIVGTQNAYRLDLVHQVWWI